MKNILRSLLFVLVALVLSVPAHAQTTIDNTTLTNAVTINQSSVVLGSVTCTSCTFGPGDIIFIDNESMRVQAAYTSGTTVPVLRGQDGTKAAPHQAAATVLLGDAVRFQTTDPPLGACLRTSQRFMPWVNLLNGVVWGCNNVTWFATVQQAYTYSSRTLSYLAPVDSPGARRVDAVLARLESVFRW